MCWRSAKKKVLSGFQRIVYRINLFEKDQDQIGNTFFTIIQSNFSDNDEHDFILDDITTSFYYETDQIMEAYITIINITSVCCLLEYRIVF